MKNSWETYYKTIGNTQPRPLLIKALQKCQSRTLALDIGAGSMADSLYLLKENFKKVVAVDSSSDFRRIIETVQFPNLETYALKIEDYHFSENQFDIVNAQFSLPFIESESFIRVWQNIKKSLVPGGIFCGQLFGVNDSWNMPDSTLHFETRDEVMDLISPFEIISFEEVENDGTTAAGSNKHWHIFNIILRKR